MNKYILIDVSVCSIAEYFYESKYKQPQVAQTPAVRWLSCEISHGEIIGVCVGKFTTALRNKIKFSIKNLILIPQCIAYCLTAYYVEKNSLQRVIHFWVYYIREASWFKNLRFWLMRHISSISRRMLTDSKYRIMHYKVRYQSVDRSYSEQ